MALQAGERYRCPEPNCGCEIHVIKGAQPGSGGDLSPRCCCGKAMQRVSFPACTAAAMTAVRPTG